MGLLQGFGFLRLRRNAVGMKQYKKKVAIIKVF